MFIKWAFMLMSFSLFNMFMYLFMFYYNNFVILEYMITSILNLDYKLYFIMDWMSSLFSCVVLFISSMVLLYSHSYMMSEKNKISFCWMVLAFVLSMILLIMMPNAFMLILGWDGLGLVSYLLVIFYQSTNSYNSGMMTIISNRFGDVMMIMMVIFMMNFGSFDLLSVNKVEFLCGMFIIIAGMTKSAQIPFSAWLPAAMAAPTPVSSLVHSSTLVTAGVYLLIRFEFMFEIMILSDFLLKISLLTMLMAGINAFNENDLKKIIAFSTLSQLSMMMVILSFNLTNLAFLHLIIHAIFKSMLFLGAGYIIHNMMGKQDIRMLSDFFSYSPLIMSCMLISSYSLMGIPFIGGFYSKDLILEFFFFKNTNLINLLMFIMGIIFTFLYNMRMIYIMFLKSVYSSSMINLSFSMVMALPIFVLTLMLLFIGNLFFWLLIPNFSLIFITSFQKILGIFMFIMIMLFYMIFMKFSNYFNFKNFEFFQTMWFLSKLTSMVFLINNNFLLKLSLFDWTWIESLGPSGLGNSLVKNIKLSLFTQAKSFAKIILIMILMIMFII
ncbi:NADH dehydrogenase subunit 5 (mitochondrion) [Dermacentor variabilis]|uniref:NADH dehydrogenase subunit 5 n=1 Tax=Dermacentor variabilis TaxID=34621 RepID=UPI001F13FABD|nr:NADH dehydrogenase subunit 5 [Dermacentor variabilis]UKT60496.1 NADH dehydrogenase subunit 5 [Dermacentor variabilis]